MILFIDSYVSIIYTRNSIPGTGDEFFDGSDTRSGNGNGDGDLGWDDIFGINKLHLKLKSRNRRGLLELAQCMVP